MATELGVTAEHCDAACRSCGFAKLCLPSGLEGDGQDRFSRGVQRSAKLFETGSPIFWSGQRFEHVYAVKSGCVKSTTVDASGNEHVRGFHLPGDLFGFDAINLGEYPASAVAVETSRVCMIPYANLMKMVTNTPALQYRMLELVSKELSLSLALAGDFTADQRIAAFLLNLYQRLKVRGMTAGRVMYLSMTRRDIAAYLRLALETVSRIFTRFEHEGLIAVDNRELKIESPEALWALAEPVGICAPLTGQPRVQMHIRAFAAAA